MIWRCANFAFDTGSPIIAGIVNVTPDSFSDGGQFLRAQDAVSHAEELVAQGAHIIDVGGESTRPAALPVSPQEELARVLPVVRELVGRGVCVSVDTRHVQVARECVLAGAAIINDVSGFVDPALVELACKCDAGLVVMHRGGACGIAENDHRATNDNYTDTHTPSATLHDTTADEYALAHGMYADTCTSPAALHSIPAYGDVVADVRDWLAFRAAALVDAGISQERICIDPGPGFGKTSQQTLELMRNFHEFARLGYPLMVAASRKRYIGDAYDIPCAADRDAASATEALLACELGASVVRTHNVSATLRALSDLRPYCYLGLGCNMSFMAAQGNTSEQMQQQERENKRAQLELAIAELCSVPDTQIVDISSFYESQPAYYLNQAPFVNAVVKLRTGVPPRELLTYLHAIENSLGRTREVENGPRTCDIDILDYQFMVVDEKELTLPHPGVCERDFVVKPLSELAPRHVLANGIRADHIPEELRVGAAHRIAT